MDRLDELFEKYRDNTASPEETEELWAYFREGQHEARLKALIDAALGNEVKVDATLKAQTDEVYGNLRKQIAFDQPEQRRYWSARRWAVAASVLLLVSVGGYFALHRKQKVQLAVNDVAPYSQQAILKTGHGITLKLDSTHKGVLAQYANTNIQQSNSDQVAYTNSAAIDEKVVFDTLQVPAGGKPYHLTLADGSRVIVNVASALRFPENFRKNNNEVQLIIGEAYFTIVHNASAPLIIKAKDQTIQDIGTQFNVNTYNDEPDSRTTLVDGKIAVNHKDLTPGYQAIMTANSLIIAKANLMQVTAWKDGYFRFNGENIQAVMRELSRWYNIEVVYEGKPTTVGFFTRVNRSKNISEVLKVLEHTTNTVHFKIEGRRVIVLGKK